MVSIHHRPAVVTERAEIGHWAGDLVMGRRPSAVATLVERHTRYVRIVPVPHGYNTDPMRRALTEDLTQLPPTVRRSLTWDRGREVAEHQELAAHLGIEVSLRDPRSPRQRRSAAATRTPTASCANTSPRTPACGRSRSGTSLTSPHASTPDPAAC